MQKQHDLFAVSQCLRYYAKQTECPCAREAGLVADECDAAGVHALRSAATAPTGPDSSNDSCGTFDMGPLLQEVGQV